MTIERRMLIQSVAGAALMLPAVRGEARAAPATPAPPAMASGARQKPWDDLGLFANPVLNSQLLHVLGATYSAQADIGEVLDTGTRIDADDEWSWPNQWVATAERVEAMGDASLRNRRRISAGKAFLRAATYYRAALLHHPDPAHSSNLRTARKAVDAQTQAYRLLDSPARWVQVPYEKGHLPGYFLRSPNARGDAPLIILQQGRDAWPENAGYLHNDALQRGYHVLFVHAPGQGLAVRQYGFGFRPDWEHVIKPIIDFAVRLSGVDARRIALLGWSMAGALIPRAAAFEKRIKLLVPNPGVLNWGASTFAQFEAYYPGVLPWLDRNPKRFDAEIAKLMRGDAFVRWYVRDAMFKHAVATPSALFQELRQYTNVPVAAQIEARTLVMDGTGEAFTVGQAKALFDALTCPKDYMLFDERDTGLLHCQEGASAVSDHRLFDWIDEYI